MPFLTFENIRWIPIGELSAKFLIGTQNCQGQKQSLMSCYCPDEPKEIGWLNIMCYPEMDPGTHAQTGYWVKTKELWIKYGLYLFIFKWDTINYTLVWLKLKRVIILSIGELRGATVLLQAIDGMWNGTTTLKTVL